MSRFIVLLCGISFVASAPLCEGVPTSAGRIAESGTLTLEQALELARTNSPELRATRMVAQAAEKGIAAAGLWNNPILQIEAEGVGGDLNGFSDGEYAIGLKQRFKRGGKRSHERDIAFQVFNAAGNGISEAELKLAEQVRLAFIGVMTQQETGKVRAEQEQLGRAFVEVAKRRHEAGGGSELDVVQAELALEEIILTQTCCFGDLVAAQETLASLIGIPMKQLGETVSPYYELDPLDALALDDSYPALQRLAAESEKVRAEARQAKAKDASDVLLGAGYKYEAAGDINSFVFSIAMPLSFNKRGRAESAAASLRADAVLAERAEVRRVLQAELSTVLALYNGAMVEVELTKNKLIPKAEQAYALSRDGYNAGRFSWLELIAAQQNLADIRIRYIESLRDAHLARAQIAKFMKEGI